MKKSGGSARGPKTFDMKLGDSPDPKFTDVPIGEIKIQHIMTIGGATPSFKVPGGNMGSGPSQEQYSEARQEEMKTVRVGEEDEGDLAWRAQ